MRPSEKIEKLIKKLHYKTCAETHNRVLGNILQALDEKEKQKPGVFVSDKWRTIMKSPITKLTATAVIIIITIVFSITLFEKATAPAYALEQTIKANNTIKTVHLRKFEKGQSIENNEFSDYWLKYDNASKLSNLRRNEHGKDGVKFTVWNEGIKKTWIPEDNVVTITRFDNTAKEWEDFVKVSNYEHLLRWLNNQVKEKEEIELKIIDEPAEDSNFIYVEATHSPSKSRIELVVDRKTKLIRKFSEYHLKERGDELGDQIEFLAYNQPIHPSMFELKGIPDNAKVIERVEGGIIVPGLRVGEYKFGMSKDEVLKKCGEPEYINFGGEGYTLDNPPGQYGMRFGGVWVEIVNDKVNGFTVLSPNYKFANGLGIGDSEQKIRQFFGNESRIQKFGRKDFLYYRDKGLMFEIDKRDRTVMEINVSPIEGSSHIPPTSYTNEHGVLIDKVDYPFVNDPKVIGGWKSVDIVRDIDDFNPANKISSGEFTVNHLIFEEGGKISRSVFPNLLTWTKGLVLSDETASKYIIREIDGSVFMFFGWKTAYYSQHHMRPDYCVLKKVSVESLKYKPWYGEKAEIPATSYFNEQGNIVDKIDYPFVNDKKVIGTWKTVDFVREMEDFKDSEKQWEHEEDRPYLKQLIFLPNGKTTDNQRTWTKGLIFHSGKKTASKYTIKKIKGKTFMFFEWKNDSYTIGYMKTKYYVLKRI
ncbi:MAG: hypothetical protein ACYTEK_23570 [Planctomycetota bacterium]|jgi:hypothetical protein